MIWFGKIKGETFKNFQKIFKKKIFQKKFSKKKFSKKKIFKVKISKNSYKFSLL